jgi:hypothetical protein
MSNSGDKVAEALVRAVVVAVATTVGGPVVGAVTSVALGGDGCTCN